MFVVVILVMSLGLAIFGRDSRLKRYGWLGTSIAIAILGIVAWAYHDDAYKLPEWFEKRNEVLTQLRVDKICLDMETQPEHWQGTGLEYPCVGYGVDDLRSEIARDEDALKAWNSAIHERQELLKERETGAFAFLQKRFGDPFR